MKYMSLAVLALGATAFAQTVPTAPTASVGEKFTSSEELALRYIMQEFNQAQQDFAGFRQDVEKRHPGFTVDQTGRIVSVPKPEVAPAPTPEKK